MLLKNFSYRGYSLSDDNSATNHIVLQNEVKEVKLRTEVYEKQNSHGSYSSTTLASGRLLTISGYIFGKNKADRFIGEQIIEAMTTPELYPSATNTWFYDLTFTDDGWFDRKISCKVYSKPTYSHDIDAPIIEFEFELYSDDPHMLSLNSNSASGSLGSYGGVKLPTKLKAKLNNKVNDFTVVNTGNWLAPVTITVTWTLTNPKVWVNDRYYQVVWVTTLLVITNTLSRFMVTENGNDITALRGAGSKTLALNPWNNVILLDSDDVNATASIQIVWNDSTF